ncbi:hypothetical protein D3C84_737710 [compost metagenome]
MLALFAQGNQFAVAHGRVDRLQRGQARQFFVGIGGQATLRLGDTFSVARQDLRFTGVDPWRQLVTLGLDELVGAGTWHAFKLVVQGFERHAGRQVVAVGVEQAAQGGRRQVAAQLQRARGNHFADIQQFQQHGARLQRLVLDQRHGGVAHGTGQHQVHAALNHRVFPGDELHVFARQRLVTVVSDGHAFVVAQREAGVEHFFARLEDQRVFRMVFAVDAEGVEQGFHVDRQGELIVLFKDFFNQRVAFTRATGVQLQQTVTAGV